jgi:glutamate synthase (NADPH/NADH) large chain
MKNYKKNLKILEDGHVYSKEMEHDACGVGINCFYRRVKNQEK